MIQTRNIFEEIKFELSDKEIIHKAKMVADMQAKIFEAEDALAAYTKDQKKKIKEIKMEKASELRAIHKGYEMRIVECERVSDFASGTIILRHKNGIVSERAMSVDERQVEMPMREYDVSSVIREETNKRTKISAVDGPV